MSVLAALNSSGAGAERFGSRYFTTSPVMPGVRQEQQEGVENVRVEEPFSVVSTLCFSLR